MFFVVHIFQQKWKLISLRNFMGHLYMIHLVQSEEKKMDT
jgi:hypothetical protein